MTAHPIPQPPKQVLVCLFLLVVIVWLAFLTNNSTTLACTPTSTPPGYIAPTLLPVPYYVATASTSATLVVEGRVKSVWNEDYSYHAQIEVKRYLKGGGPASLATSYYVDPCGGQPPYPGLQGTFFISQIAGPSGPVWDVMHSEKLYIRSDYTYDDFAHDVAAATGQQPTQPTRPASYYAPYVIAACIGILVVVWRVLAQRRKKEPAK